MVDPRLLCDWEGRGGRTSYITMRLHDEVALTVAALIIQPLGYFFQWGKHPRNIEASLRFPPQIVDPSGSILSKATVHDARSRHALP
jgi:hypothetical protein